MELYTSLVRLKQVLNGGHLPAMMSIPEEATRHIDPSFTIGLGALYEDEELGLRCPVRGCGRFYQQLTMHLDKSHGVIGGARAVREILSIPHTAALTTARHRALASERSARRQAENRPKVVNGLQNARTRIRNPGQAGRQAQILSARSRRTIGSLNMRNLCEAQITHKIIDLHNEIGRSPTRTELEAKYGGNLRHLIDHFWGSYANCLTQLGLDAKGRRKTIGSADVLEGLRNWYETHGDLPSSFVAKRGDKIPFFASYKTILKAMDTEDWGTAMRRVAAHLCIYGGRYGLPEKKRAV